MLDFSGACTVDRHWDFRLLRHFWNDDALRELKAAYYLNTKRGVLLDDEKIGFLSKIYAFMALAWRMKRHLEKQDADLTPAQ